MQWSSGRARHPRRAPLAALACALTLFAVSAALPSTHAAFSAATTNQANALSADQLAPPSGFSATQTCSAPAAIALQGAVASTSLSPLALSPPTGIQRGDVLLAQVAHYGAPNIQAPGGWNLILAGDSGNVVASAVYWKVATTGEPTAYFSRPNTSGGDMVGGIVAYRGVDVSSPVAVAGSSTGSGVTATTRALTTTATDAVVAHFLTKQGAQLRAPTSTQLWKLSSDTEGATAASEPFAGPGTTSSRTSTSGGDPPVDSAWIAQTVVLRHAPGTPSASLSWTASPSTWATGYQLERRVGSTVQATKSVTGSGTTSTTDGPLVNGTTYTYSVEARRGAWTSSAATTSITPSC